MKTNSSPNIDGKQQKKEREIYLAVQANRAWRRKAPRPQACTPWRRARCMQGQAGPTCPMQPRLAAHACMQGQAGPTCRTRPQDGADTHVKAVVSDHAPLRGGRGWCCRCQRTRVDVHVLIRCCCCSRTHVGVHVLITQPHACTRVVSPGPQP
jgi:hypothetical protein